VVNEVRCYTVSEVADLLGLGETFVRSQIKAGALRAAQFGDGEKRPLRVPHPRLLEYIAAHTE
jgi:excisionase family DNA binding protein